MMIQSQVNNDNNVSNVNIYVKQVYTCLTKNYEVSNNLSIDEMISQLNINILRDYRFDVNQYELVEVAQTIENGIIAEESDPIINSAIETVRDRYNRECVAFYIRPFPNQSPTPAPVIQAAPIRSSGECMICWNSGNEYRLGSYFIDCLHIMCRECRSGCITAGLTTCPMCRGV